VRRQYCDTADAAYGPTMAARHHDVRLADEACYRSNVAEEIEPQLAGILEQGHVAMAVTDFSALESGWGGAHEQI
jgi:hypothetical protein